VSYLKGRHSFKFGGELRRFRNGNFTGDVGSIDFNTPTHFQQGLVDSFVQTPGSAPSRITQDAIEGFVQDGFRVKPYFTLELGLRYAWYRTPIEALDRFVVFDPVSDSLLQVNHGISEIFPQSNKNFQPRLGFAWNLNGKTVLRAGYGYAVQQPNTNYFTGLSLNPPFTARVLFNNANPPVPVGAVASSAAKAGLAPRTINSNFKNAVVQSWNLNLQREITPTLGLMIGYFGNKGTFLQIDRDLNQPLNPAAPLLTAPSNLPFPSLSASSPIRPGAALTPVITFRDSVGNSNYNAMWIAANKRMSAGLQFNASYTWSHSIDYNSLNAEGIVVQDSRNLRGDRGSSDFDVRNRFVINTIYELPFKGNRLISGWEFASIATLESGNPLDIALGIPSFNGVGGGTIRPDLIGPIVQPHTVAQWIVAPLCDPKLGACAAGSALAVPDSPNHFGNLGRNSVVGPPFKNWDFSVIKNTKITERTALQFRTDVFDILNHPNFANPTNLFNGGILVAAPDAGGFGTITATRFPTGDFGSARQLQLSLRLMF
jgi:hypothetical protein